MAPRGVEDRQLLPGKVLSAGGNPEIGDGLRGDPANRREMILGALGAC
jgi:hypothetical protein